MKNNVNTNKFRCSLQHKIILKFIFLLITSVIISSDLEAQSAQSQYRFSEIKVLDNWIECTLIRNERDRLLILLTPDQAEGLSTTRRLWVNKHSISSVRIRTRVYDGIDDFRIETDEMEFNPNFRGAVSSRRQAFLGSSLIFSGAMLIITALVDVDDADTSKLILTGAGVGLGVAGAAAIAENLNEDAYPSLETILLMKKIEER